MFKAMRRSQFATDSIAQLTHFDKRSPAALGIFLKGGHRHQSFDTDITQRPEVRHQRGHFFWRETVLIRFPASIDLQKDRQSLLSRSRFGLQRLDQSDTVNRMNQANERKCRLDLVALQMADQVPAHALRQGRRFPPELLGTALAEIEDSKFRQQ